MELIFATHNPNKLEEIQAMMPGGIKLLSLEDVGLHDEIPETASTIAENAVLKTDYVRKRLNKPVFADDTGLIIPALNGAPGVRSARYAGENRDSNDNIDLVLKNLKGKQDRSAHFLTVISLYLNGVQHLFEGICTGEILEHRTGNNGFGYDPVFQPDGFSQSFAEMDLQEKAAISHRGKAFQKMVQFLETLNIDN
ncbi:RdgB/HAM1 family non-canonical purine NTP pyrophosphatase [Nonlabens marinus]|uniref:dITP/XTP pyrophosphatase n=1 Tax=Nonlabens marinus S1-08 TaxID=1454201 RepID=W8VT24_9FLAO|nr:RdgB/HAM1 family non-canonical purine NTP pyrophosphatase [Nonlabens marinus]BAO56695.1 nucleoside 5-triphosphatase RdgB [Nonlabens marinus S1-08]